MKKKPLPRLLSLIALGIFAAGTSVWIAAVGRIGWTQTSIVAMHLDEITGIDYPVRQAAFRPGVEVPLLASAMAATLAGIAFIARRRIEARA